MDMMKVNWSKLDKQLKSLQRHLYLHLGAPHCVRWEDAQRIQIAVIHIHIQIQIEMDKHKIYEG